MALRWRQPPGREWFPLLVALLLVAAGAVLLISRGDPVGLFLIVPGAVLWVSVVLYRTLTATEED